MSPLISANMANIFEFAASRLLAIQSELETSTLVTSPRDRQIVVKYLIWEGDAFILPWVAFCEGMSINPPLSRNLRFFVSTLGMKQVELLDEEEVYASFMKLRPEPGVPWVRGRLVKNYPLAWWDGQFTILPYREFLKKFPDSNEMRKMIADHFAQLPESRMLVMPATLVHPRSTPLAQQLATIHAEIEQEGNEIWKMMENKVVEAKIVAASLMKMETALGQDVIAAITATDALVKYLSREPKNPIQPATSDSE
ncbi:hypothetical protein DFJ58DRAFT_837308 [Suillus subalutaceus]|uniref:uncharacterized protein n=1 Tax=Suillus subalutaceus TaxID=48586 RepID=UPI001B88189D|nr:uncharacterized protein DFJ58DRAFT_837308 [Suillus subalutaceus]KAG1871357.1 hypothetical protein DFJ58DRAFT_837308 [Suillus subalutaceus]